MMSLQGLSREQAGDAVASRRELWRLHGPARVVSAVLYQLANGCELRVFFEPEHERDVLEREYGTLPALERRAATLRQELVDQGWVELGSGPATAVERQVPQRRTGVLALLSVVSGVVFWMWRRYRATDGDPAALAAESPSASSAHYR